MGMTASIPKFGAWDDTDPKSGEGFTVVFNRVKEEKQIASTTFPSVPIQPVNRQITSQRNQGSSSSLSKMLPFSVSFTRTILLSCSSVAVSFREGNE
ncbi:RPM1-interacting protein [Populus alba x Populus x berolinensis]|nr:RPM1-interacting protein [Populus alba x Populus x berolinensis]